MNRSSSSRERERLRVLEREEGNTVEGGGRMIHMAGEEISKWEDSNLTERELGTVI